MLVSALEKIGLSKQEAEVYLATLRLGEGKASTIAQKVGMQRGGVYYVLRLLKEKGFMSEVIKSGVLHYSAVTPKRIEELLEEENKRKKGALSSVFGELEAMRSFSLERPLVEVYEGHEGFKTIFLKLLELGKKEFRAYMSSSILDYLPHFHEQFRKKRAKAGISIRTIVDDCREFREIRKLDKVEKREIRFHDFIRGTDMLYYILDDAVVAVRANKHEQLALFIEDKFLARMQINMFEELWKYST